MPKKTKGKLVLPVALDPFEGSVSRTIVYAVSDMIKENQLPTEFQEFLEQLLEPRTGSILPTVDGVIEHSYNLGKKPLLHRNDGGLYSPQLDTMGMTAWDLEHMETYVGVYIFLLYRGDASENETFKQAQEVFYAGKVREVDPHRKLLVMDLDDDSTRSFEFSRISGVERCYGNHGAHLASLKLTFSQERNTTVVHWELLGYTSRIPLPVVSESTPVRTPQILDQLTKFKGKTVTVTYPQDGERFKVNMRLVGYYYRPKSRRITLRGTDGLSVSGNYDSLKVKEYRKADKDWSFKAEERELQESTSKRRLFRFR